MPMKGGSVASSAVESLVQAPTWDKLNVQFDNQVGGKKKASSKKEKPSKKQDKEDKQGKQKKQEKQEKQENKRQKGGFCPACGGGMKHINDFENEGVFNLYNKKGGANPSFALNYNYSDAMMKPQHGDVINRGLNTDIVSVMASESPSTLGSMSKTVEFGNVFDAPKVPFVYTGGSKKASKSSIKSSKTSKTSKTSKASQAKKTKPSKKQ